MKKLIPMMALLALQGCATAALADERRILKEVVVKAGSAVFIPAMAEHGVRQTGSERLRFFYGFPIDSLDKVEYLFSTVWSA